jgi:8-oxoguanine deaminase
MTLLIHNATVITPAAGELQTLFGHSLAIDGQWVTGLAPAGQVVPDQYDEVIAGDRFIVIPGLVNTHHHLYQTLTRCLPAAQNLLLFDWLRVLYERWREVDYRSVNLAAKVAIAELLRHGCTTTSDHFYMLPPGRDARMEAVLDAAEELGIRIHLCRGSMSLGASGGGLPPDDCVEADADVLADSVRVIDAYHDDSAGAMRRIDLAPCSPFNVTPELMRDTRDLARARGVRLHTHLAETVEEERYCLEKYGRRPVGYLADLDWLGPDVYLAHCVYLNDDEIALLAKTGTSVSHNPTSNLRLGSGIAPGERLLDAGVTVGLGVDGASSNDGGNPLAAAKMALLSARVRWRFDAADPAGARGLMAASTALRLATSGGAACLGRTELGHLQPGAAADFALFHIDDVALAGAAIQDPVAALVLCDSPPATHVYCNGRRVVENGRLKDVDEEALGAALNECVAARFAW